MRLYGKFNLLVTLVVLQLGRVSGWCLNRQTAEVGTIAGVQYSQDRSMFITAASGKATLWSAVNFLILTRVSPASASATDAKISKNNTIFGVATSTSMVYLYSTSAPYTLLRTITAGLGGSITKIDFSYDGTQLLACGGTSNSAKIYDLTATGGFVTHTNNNVVGCKFSAESNSYGTVSSNNKIDYFAFSGPPSTWTQNVNGCTDLDISVAAPTYLVAVCGSKAYTMPTTTHSPANPYTGSTLRSASISADGSYAAFGGDQKIIMFLDGSGAPTFTISYNFTLDAQIYASDFSADSNYLLVGTKSGSIYEYSKFCLDCPVGTYQNMSSLTCALCSLTNRGCGSCINSSYCVQCTQGFYLEQLSAVGVTTRQCLKCSIIEGCIVCNSSTVCLMCEVGYYLSGSICATCNGPMPGCLRCNNSNTCEQCTSDYYLSGSNKCVICTTIGGCSLCLSSSYCSICQIGYYNNAGTCAVCSTNCLACQSATTCLDCRQGYYPTTGATVCIACSTTGCLSCNQTGYCLQCATHRYLDGTGSCVPCTFPCNECNSTVCINCMAGFYLDWVTGGGTSASSGGTCQLCNHPCQTCNTSTYCLSCPLGYYLVSASHTCLPCDNLTPFCEQCSPTACLNCSLGYYLDTAVCKPCTTPMYSCVGCTSSSACLKCAPGFYLTAGSGNSSCATCPGGCELCNSTAYCFGCLPGYYKDGGNACVRCSPPCTICTSASACIECQEQYYLPAASTTCAPCRDAIPDCIACDDELATLECTSCRVGYFLAAGSCTACTLPCLVCNSSACLQCEIGYYVSSTNTCTICPQNCTACTSSSVCSSCTIGFFLNATDNRCYHCSTVGCMTCNSTPACLSCPQGYYLTGTSTCNKCLSSMQFCQQCTAANLCQSCSFGYTLSASNDKCVICSSLEGCFDCSSLTSCDVCENGYYLVTTSGSGVCNVCPPGCVTCSSSTACITCLPSFILQASSCKLCQQLILGCQLCTDASTCIDCSNGYYSSGSSCTLCRSTLKGCQFCNSSSVCTYCAQGYYLLANNTCTLCETTMQGCEVCSSSSVCELCENGYYLAAGSCLVCNSSMPGCLSCTDASTCLQCIQSYAIDAATLQCSMCKSSMTGCISCSSLTYCEQCEAGYYLRTSDHTCQACTQVGCEVCYEASSGSCVSCNTMYFISANVCYYCGDYMEGCIECTSNSVCTLCQTGYFLNGTTKCQLCQTSLQGCAKCNNSATCYECKSTYHLYATTNKCKTCLSALEGCSYCLDLSECISCSNSYYKNFSTGFCQLCTNIEGCLACTDYDTCLVCKGDYFLQTNATENLCYPCDVMEGCYSCINNITCIVCVGGYILNDDKLCEVYRVQADQPVKGMKMISQYIDQNTLSHSLLANQMKYAPKQFTIQEWRNSTDIILQHPSFKMENLTISGTKWVSGNQLMFYTNNPVKIDMKALPARRRLSAMPDGYKTLIKMKQDTINVILPDLYLSHSLVMDYDLASPEFYASITQQKFNLFQSAFGIIIVVILTLNYLIRAIVTCPNQALSEYGQILPHVLALKAPAFIIFPLFPEQFSFCFGFMAAEFPWARDAFSVALSDKSESMPKQYSLFYHSMSFGSTYMLACCIGVSFIAMMWLYKKNNENQHKTNNSKLRREEPEVKKEESRWGLPDWPIKMVMYNFFFFGLVFNGCASLQNAIYNPMSEISVSAVFTVIGIICFGLAFTDCLYSLYESPLYFFKLRIFTKAVLLSVCHFSPIYLFSSAFVVDLICLVIQYRLTIDNKTFPKLWIYNNIAANLALALLVFVHSHITTLIIAGVLILSVIIIQFYVHYQDYITQKKRGRFMLKKEYKLQQKSLEIDDGLNIWNINFQHQKQSQIPSKDISQPISPEKKSSKVRQDSQILQTFYENRRIKPTRKPRKQKRGNPMELNHKQESQQNLDHLMVEDHDGKDNNTFLAGDFLK